MLKKIFNFFGYSFYSLYKSNKENEIIDFQIKKLKIDIIIDCGANHGDFYKIIKKHNKKVILFEPNSELFKKLNYLKKNDKNLIVFDKGTDKKNCRRKIFLTNDTGKTLSSIKKQNAFIKERFKNSSIINTKTIDLVSLDYILRKLKITKKNKIFLKLDTQGNDYETLMGIKNKINQVKFIKIEMPVIHLYQKVKTHWEILNFLRKNQFKPIHFTNGPRDKNGRIIEYDALFIKD